MFPFLIGSNPMAYSLKPTSVEPNLQDLRDSWKMTTIVQGNRQKKGRQTRSPGESKDNGLCWQLVIWQNSTR